MRFCPDSVSKGKPRYMCMTRVPGGACVLASTCVRTPVYPRTRAPPLAGVYPKVGAGLNTQNWLCARPLAWPEPGPARLTRTSNTPFLGVLALQPGFLEAQNGSILGQNGCKMAQNTRKNTCVLGPKSTKTRVFTVYFPV